MNGFLHGDVNRDVNRKMTHECFNFSSLLQIQKTLSNGESPLMLQITKDKKENIRVLVFL